MPRSLAPSLTSVFTTLTRAPGSWALAVVLGVLLGARLWGLEADPPAGLTPSGAPYTDEGWYAHAAVAWARGEPLYRPHDFNPWLHVPGWPALLAPFYGLLGASLWTSRLVARLCFSFIVVAPSVWAWRREGPWAALVVAAPLCAHMPLYGLGAYALLELPMVAMVGLSLLAWAGSARPGKAWLRAVAYVAFVWALSIKPSAIAFVPCLAYLAWRRFRAGRLASPRAELLMLVPAGLLADGATLLSHAHPIDIDQFYLINVDGVVVDSLGVWLAQIPATWSQWFALAPPWEALGATACVAALALPRARRDDVYVTLVIAAVGYYTLLTLETRDVPRYYLPLHVVASLLLARALVLGARALPEHLHARTALATLVAAAAAWASVPIVQHQLDPRHSMRDACAAIAAEVGDGLLIGQQADHFALCAGLRSANLLLRTPKPGHAIEELNATHYVALGHKPGERRMLDDHYDVTPIAEYDVYGNYLSGRPTALFRLERRPSPRRGANTSPP